MGKEKLVLFLALCLSVNVILVSARAKPEGKGDFWSDEEEVEEDEVVVKETPAEEKQRSLGGHDEHKGHDDHKSAPQPTQNSNANNPNQFGNIAGFNETCGGSSSRMCNTRTNLFCSNEGRCACVQSYVYIGSQESCKPISIDGSCEFNDQCHAGKWGKHARCERGSARCQCYDVQLSGKRETVFIDEICYIKLAYNDPCESDVECQASIPGGSFCAPQDPSAPPHYINATQACQCRPGFIWYNPGKRCLKIADQDLASTCGVDLQCQMSPLGNLSKCGLESVKCECHDFANPGPENVVFYKPLRTCFAKKDWNDTCTRNEECMASISSQAECLEAPEDYEGGGYVDPALRKRTCQCPQGRTCPRDVDDGDGAFELGSNYFNLAILLATVFIFGRRG